MTLRARTYEEMQAYLLHQSRRKELKRIASDSLRYASGELPEAQRKKLATATNRLLLKAAFGHGVFKQKHGPFLGRLAAFEQLPLTKEVLDTVRKELATGSQQLMFAVRPDPDKLASLSDREKEALTHRFECAAIFFSSTAKR